MPALKSRLRGMLRSALRNDSASDAGLHRSPHPATPSRSRSGVSVVCFSLVYLAPGDPLQTILPPDATAEMVEIVKHAYGFDRPLPVQYLIWLGHVLTGDFGMSIATRRR